MRFVSDDPPPALVDRMTQSWIASNGDIAAVVRTMYRSPEFWSPEVYRAKVKTPLEFVVSALRASGAEITKPEAAVQALDRLGMPLYGMQTPNGYSWVSEPWVSTGALVTRMNFALVLAGNRLGGTWVEWRDSADPMNAAAAGLTTASATSKPITTVPEAQLERVILGEPVSERTRRTILTQSQNAELSQQAERDFVAAGGRTSGIGQSEPSAPASVQTATIAGLLLGSPEFQRR